MQVVLVVALVVLEVLLGVPGLQQGLGVVLGSLGGASGVLSSLEGSQVRTWGKDTAVSSLLDISVRTCCSSPILMSSPWSPAVAGVVASGLQGLVVLQSLLGWLGGSPGVPGVQLVQVVALEVLGVLLGILGLQPGLGVLLGSLGGASGVLSFQVRT